MLLCSKSRSMCNLSHSFSQAIQKEPWNRFDIPTLKIIHDNFQKYADDAKHGSSTETALITNELQGVITRAASHALHRRLGLRDEKVIESLFRFWDHNNDQSIDYY